MSSLRLTFKVMLMVTVATATVTSCSDDEHHSYVANITDPAKTPTMSTADVSTLISDSGYTRYHITADRWDIYDDTEDPTWIFPYGLQLENYDLLMHPAATLVCDSATYYSKRRLWRLDGNIVMVNVKRDTFLTQQLFWDQNRAEVYCDSFIHIVRTNHIIEGYGFTSDQTMSAYRVNRPTAIIPINRTTASQTPAPATDTADSAAPGLDPSGRPQAPEPASVRYRRSRDYISGEPTAAGKASPAVIRVNESDVSAKIKR